MGSGRNLRFEPRFRIWRSVGVGLALVGWLWAAPIAAWQASDEETVFFPADRTSLQRLAAARKLLASEHYDEAVRVLGAILDSPEDYFFRPPGDEEGNVRSLKGETRRLIGSLPPKGLASYELQFGAEARALLNQALRDGRPEDLTEVARRFLHTQAGRQASELLGTDSMEHGRPLFAALWFERLLSADAPLDLAVALKAAVCWYRAGQASKGEAILERIRQQDPDASFAIAGQSRKLFAAGKPQPWLLALAGAAAHDRSDSDVPWLLVGGSADRNAASIGGSPLIDRRWRVRSIEDPRLELAVEQLHQSSLDQGVSGVPAWQPLVVGDVVLMRSMTGVVAVDFRTGKRLWKGVTDPAVTDLLDSRQVDALLGNPILAPKVERWIWQDATYGTMSSDGQAVFCVEDAGLDTPTNPFGRLVVGPAIRSRAGVDAPPASHRLTAYDVGTGAKRWELPSAAGKAVSGLEAAWFLGPPLPLAGRLYTLAEIKGEIRLLVLDARTGQLDWSQQLAVVEESASEDDLRRLVGSSPSYADGTLVCPTAAGAVVALDLTTRSLLWGYSYHNEQPQNRPRLRFNAGMNSSPGESDRWADATAVVADGRVLLAPPRETADSGEVQAHLHCLDLADGHLLWKQPREDGLYVGCVVDGQVLVVGRTAVRCYKLSDGESAWAEPALALGSGTTPSGRGFHVDGRYYLPVSSAEVLVIDLKQGEIIKRCRSRAGQSVGNLVCHRGSVLSQDADALDCFHQLDALQVNVRDALAKNPNDPAALASQGQLLFDDGKLDEAIGVLRRSFGLEATPRTHELLVDALLEGLKSDFAAHRASVPELERLVDQPASELMFLRTLADGLQKVGETMPAFETYVRILNLGRPLGELDRLDGVVTVRRDRWVQRRLKSLWDAAKPDERKRIDVAIEARLATAKTADALREFLGFFGSHPLAQQARERLYAALPQDASPLERERLLSELSRSPDAEQARAAVARLAQLMHSAGRPGDARIYQDQLAGPLAEQVCLDGKTGRELAAALPAAGDELASRSADAWPRESVRAELITKDLNTPQYRNFPVDLRWPKGPFFDHSLVELDQPRQALIGRDGAGRETWRAALVDRNDRNQPGFNPTLSHARAQGHLLLLSIGYQVLAIDTLGGGGQQGPQVLWRHDLTDPMPGPRQLGIHGLLVNMPWGQPRFVAADANNRQVGNTGPLTDRLACFQRQRSIVAVDPFTGQTLWTRGGIQPGSEIFGDDEMLFVTPRNGNEALVLDAVDGRELGRRTVPGTEQRMATLGSRVAVWASGENKMVLRLYDPWKKEDVWQRQFEAGSKIWPVDDRTIGVFERQGRIVLVDLEDGHPQLDAKVPAEPTVTEVFVFRNASRDLVVVNRPWQNRDGENVQPVPGGFGNPLINGLVHGFDRQTGKLVFSTPIENRSLTFTQPADLPVLVFAAQIYRQQQRRGMNEVPPKAMLLCLDKRTGKIVYDDATPGPITTIELSGNVPKKQVSIRTIRSMVRLTFSDEPPSAKKEPAPLSERAGKALLEGTRKWFEQLVPLPKPVGP